MLNKICSNIYSHWTQVYVDQQFHVDQQFMVIIRIS